MTENNTNTQPVLMRGILTVKEKIYLSPHYIRIILEGGDISMFSAARIGDNNKIVIPHVNIPLTLQDLENLSSKAGSELLKLQIRTYTLRALDLNNQLMTIDFVAHGENGPASKWATHAAPGDQLGVLMKEKEKPLFLPAESYLLLGDHTALPVISVILESLPATARGTAIIEVYGPEDVLPLTKPENMELIWKFNPSPGASSTLTDYLNNQSLPDGADNFIFAAAESVTAQEIQRFLSAAGSLRRDSWRCYSFWKHGQSEGSPTAEK